MDRPILGNIPNLLRAGRTAPAVIEELRSIRIRLQDACGPGPMTMAITSHGASEGKTFITANLGLSFADAGMRTIVLDGDVRQGGLHRLLEAKRIPGLADYLNGDAGQEEIVQETTFPSLWFIACGRRFPQGAELLSSPGMGGLITSLRAQFDVTLVDTASVSAGDDPLVLGSVTGNVLCVLPNRGRDRDAAQASIGALDRPPLHLLGIVMNG